MADVSLSINGGPAVLLEPGKVYRIGRKEAYEFCVADESMELYHALATVYRAGVLRVNALLGKVFVNDVENGNADISHAHAIDGKVKLRFGNVEAEVQLIDPLQHHDSSGFGEALRDTSVDTTAESLVIPETEVQSANTSANTTADSFFVPETQAVVFDSSTKGGKVSLGEDFMIPETQDLLRTPPPPAVVHNEAGNSNDGDASEMGSQIRISTQDFNQFDEDALDDFDSSMVLGDAVAPLSHIFGKQIRHGADGTEFELSALNWSASNSKCTVLNSSKDRGVACMTPDLSGQNPSHDAGNCTPDLFDMMVADEGLPEKSATPTLCGLKQLIVATIETPTATPLEAEDKENQDFIVPLSKVPEENNETNQDFIATQPFPFTLVSEQKAGWQAIETLKDRSSGEETNQDFIATQPFPFSSKHKRGGLPSVDSPKDRSNGDETNEDFIATQLFPTRKNLKRLHAAASTRDHSDNEDNQDFSSQIKQAKLQETDLPDDHSYYKNTREDKENIPVKNTDTETKAQTSRDAAALDSLKYDDVMELLLEMDAGAPLPTADPNEPQIKFVQPSIIKDDEYNAKITRMESVFLDRNNKHRRRLTKLPEGARGRIVGSESPPRTTRNAYQRRFSVESPRIEPRKRPANAENSVEPHSKVRRPPWNSLVAEEDKRAVSKESTPEMLAKKRSSNSKTSTNTHLDSASSSKVKRAIEPKKEEDVVPNEPRRRQRNAKSIEKRQEEAADNGNTSEEGVAKKIENRRGMPLRRLKTKPVTKQEAETDKANTEVNRKGTKQQAETDKVNSSAEVKRRVGRPKKSKTPTPQDTTESKIKKEKPPEKEKANTSAVGKRWVGRLRKSETPTGDDDPIKPKVSRSETPPTTGRITRRNTAKEDPKEEPQSKAAATREFVVRIKKDQQRKSSSVPEEESDGPTTSTAAAAAAAAQQKEMPGKKGRTRSSQGIGPSSQENALKAINQHVRKAKGQGKIKIAFSMCNLAELASVLKALKHSVEKTDDPLNCDILIMDKGDRTYKFLVGMAANKPILSSSWLQSMRATSRATVEAEHLFSDSNFEKLYQFDPLMALQHPQLLSGLNFMLCEGIQPNQNEMKAIIESAGGRVYTKPPVLEHKLYVIAVAKDINRHKRLLRNHSNVQYITTEGIMKTLVQHNLALLNDPKVQI